MFKSRLFLFSLLLITVFAWSLDVKEDELSAGKNADVKFDNYSGPRVKYNTVDQIRGIGRYLAQRLGSEGSSASYYSKYRILHIVDNDSPKLGADIFIIEKSSMIDHINNIQLILAAYLEERYSYSPKDASLLSRFICYYNAVYRRDLNYFSSKYSAKVLQNISANNAGIALSWKDWPGKTRMLIPLWDGDKADPGELTDEKVIEKLREEDDKGLDDRKEIVEHHEKELEEKEKEVEKEEREIEKKEQDLKRRKEQNEEKKEEIKEQKEEIKELEEEKDKEKDPEKKEEIEKEIEEKKEQVEKEEKEVNKEDQNILKDEKQVKEEKEELKDKQQDIAKRNEDIKKQRESIAGDQNEVIDKKNEKEKAKAEVHSQALMLIKRPDGEVRNLQIFSISRQQAVEKSDLSIHSREIREFNGGLLFIAGEEGPNQAIRAVLVDKANLQTLKTGDTDLLRVSSLLISGNSFFAVARKEEGNYLAKFNANLELLAISKEAVLPDTAIIENSGNILVQAPDYSILVFSSEGLAKKQAGKNGY